LSEARIPAPECSVLGGRPSAFSGASAIASILQRCFCMVRATHNTLFFMVYLCWSAGAVGIFGQALASLAR